MAMMISQILLSRLSAFAFALHHSPFPFLFDAVTVCFIRLLSQVGNVTWSLHGWMDVWMDVVIKQALSS